MSWKELSLSIGSWKYDWSSLIWLFWADDPCASALTGSCSTRVSPPSVATPTALEALHMCTREQYGTVGTVFPGTNSGWGFVKLEKGFPGSKRVALADCSLYFWKCLPNKSLHCDPGRSYDFRYSWTPKFEQWAHLPKPPFHKTPFLFSLKAEPEQPKLLSRKLGNQNQNSPLSSNNFRLVHVKAESLHNIITCCRVKTWSKIWVFLSQNLVQDWVKTWSKIVFLLVFSNFIVFWGYLKSRK